MPQVDGYFIRIYKLIHLQKYSNNYDTITRNVTLRFRNYSPPPFDGFGPIQNAFIWIFFFFLEVFWKPDNDKFYPALAFELSGNRSTVEFNIFFFSRPVIAVQIVINRKSIPRYYPGRTWCISLSFCFRAIYRRSFADLK